MNSNSKSTSFSSDPFRSTVSVKNEKEIFNRNQSDLRSSYYNKLVQKKLFPSPLQKEEQRERAYNSIIVFDWDDTLLCSTHLVKNNFFESDEGKSRPNEKFLKKLSKLELNVMNLLAASTELGDTYIITNSSEGWVEYSSKKYFPSVYDNFISQNQVKIISAREHFMKAYPDDDRMWKLCAFAGVMRRYRKDYLTNLIAIGDNEIEINAAIKIKELFNECFVKTIKLREAPSVDQVIKQVNLVFREIKWIHSAVRNVSIVVEKKRV